MILRYFYDDRLAQASYPVGCAATGEALVVDPMREIGPYVDAAEREGLRITHVTETHIHADYVSGSRELATYAARLGAEVTLVDRDVIGGAAHLWDCIPSKTMIATGGAMSFTRRLEGMGLEQQMPEVDVDALTERIESIKMRLQRGTTNLLTSQGVQLVHGSARMLSPHDVEVTETAADGRTSTRSIVADAVLIATGTRPRIPEWCQPDGERVLTTRDCYPPKVFPEAVTIVGSGVTGVEFVHIFSSFGAKVTLVVSRQQVLPSKDPRRPRAPRSSRVRCSRNTSCAKAGSWCRRPRRSR